MKRTAAPKPRQPHPADDISFMCRRRQGGGIDYWIVEPSGDYGADCKMGHVLAREYLDYLAKYPTVGNALLLGDIVHDMMEQAARGKKWSGIHVTFLHDVNRHSMAMAAALARPSEAVASEREAA